MSANAKIREINCALDDGQTIRDGVQLRNASAAISLSRTACTLPATTFGGAITPSSATGTASSGAVTMTSKCGVITTEALTTAQNATYTLTITATGLVTANVPILATIGNGTNSAATPVLLTATRTDANTLTIVVANKHSSAVALNGTLVISYWILG